MAATTDTRRHGQRLHPLAAVQVFYFLLDNYSDDILRYDREPDPVWPCPYCGSWPSPLRQQPPPRHENPSPGPGDPQDPPDDDEHFPF